MLNKKKFIESNIEMDLTVLNIALESLNENYQLLKEQNFENSKVTSNYLIQIREKANQIQEVSQVISNQMKCFEELFEKEVKTDGGS
ncbi:hypothetical protein CIRMBP1230_02253 [Enterococcus cecorum]|uniref:Uncharacterized protein n=1 Tax=Enterococcus cecorum TaxID=44008 RepID=A0A1Y4QM07_9ENTE|nr:hypothetical protein [Enterococcus cecorum]OUQ06318.1 hypothetical protein B5E88_12495 [Enterococcus cecorum]CAI3312445.1 hypothetical protein CIRMBP1273_00786 [Enterococcus cecorum]CAI3383359.1 hypothetical protein CIRMBP1216_01442 [Enterococcus cecorum]CAI3417337.1 hypothetical protein CIRMBP1224_01700 [Enterococcus cecorum]CAI3429088.1 hypothetical protein CIRMBP1219_01958 [Enterococcus cecorum]